MLEKTIVSNLLFNDEYYRKVLPYIREDYFEDPSLKKIFSTLNSYVNQYKGRPSIEALKISIDNRKDLNESLYKEIQQAVDNLSIDKDTDIHWLIDETEKFCQDKDLYNSIRKAILILDGQDKNADKGEIPKLLSDSLGISFDNNIGHDFLEDYENRYDHYHRREERLPFDIEILNKITKGGLPRKSMTVFLATTGGGKSLLKCHIAATNLMYGKNVLYITMELPEKEVAKRIDANILNTPLDELLILPRETFSKRINSAKSKTVGKLIIKEYPTGSAHAGHFRHLLNELRIKKNFSPDIILVDYLNICASSRVKGSAAANSYTLVKSIAEEIRGLAMEFNTAIVTSSQFNRAAYDTSDVDLSNTSESMGITHTADAIFGLISTEELELKKQIMIKQLKNRWGDISQNKRFLVGMDRSMMKIYELEESVQQKIQSENISKKGNKEKNSAVDTSIFDKSEFNTQWDFGNKGKKVFKTEDII